MNEHRESVTVMRKWGPYVAVWFDPGSDSEPIGKFIVPDMSDIDRVMNADHLQDAADWLNGHYQELTVHREPLDWDDYFDDGVTAPAGRTEYLIMEQEDCAPADRAPWLPLPRPLPDPPMVAEVKTMADLKPSKAIVARMVGRLD